MSGLDGFDCTVEPTSHETQGIDEKCLCYQNFMLSEQLGILNALPGSFSTSMLTKYFVLSEFVLSGFHCNINHVLVSIQLLHGRCRYR